MDITVFRKKNYGRENNDKNNSKRENILLTLFRPSGSPEIQEIHIKFLEILKEICPVKFDDLKIQKKAGRRYNYDFHFSFLYEGLKVHESKIEFKHNAKNICGLPQYFNCPEKTRFIEDSYAKFFYDNFLDKICDEKQKPSEQIYMKEIYKNSSKCEFFIELKLKESIPEFKEEKTEITHESIKQFLELYASKINIDLLNSEIKRTQANKTFLCWDGGFYLDKFSDDELHIESFVRIKNNNTIVMKSKSGEHHMLLRWKNHLGVLYPAWQIKLCR
jgi:uncharacterized alkaline shock family protein YloU